MFKSTAYTSLVRPHLEYASCVWDPYQVNQIQSLEKVQRRAARWVMSDYSRESSVSAMIHHLAWSTLQSRRQVARLTMLHKAIYVNEAIQITSYFSPPQ